ncbi:class I SAM-dependent methyltransferase [Paracoccus alkenifer]|uniref:Ubiquinone/menaquinone biosynthesis C-methylase UbiE n=1 Tax=Paracoccus alkenifer TaxID=65735 RepID=A0A1H6K5W4_9RHOB|nr:class I SAM-dependent methyltransferase [Paracoccus alkenifer]SEH67778.1 Ubiquinone/menaquinone biosynthesis C-methylase UbiE [Paracoccus alkenifer]
MASAPDLAPSLVTDELDLIRRALPVAGADLLDLGCGDGAMARRLAEAGARVTAVEVSAAPVIDAAVTAIEGRAEALPLADAAFDAVLMLKSLHHVPIAGMEAGLREVARVLRPGGLLFCWEPVFAGPLNDIMRLFHDEQPQRAAALAALHRIIAEGTLEFVDERLFRTRIGFADFADFDRRMLHLPDLPQPVEGALLDQVRQAWDRIAAPRGGQFERLMRLTLARRP